MNGQKGCGREAETTEREEGREGGKVSKVLPARGSHRLMLWSSAGKNRRSSESAYVYVCVRVGGGGGGG